MEKELRELYLDDQFPKKQQQKNIYKLRQLSFYWTCCLYIISNPWEFFISLCLLAEKFSFVFELARNGLPEVCVAVISFKSLN